MMAISGEPNIPTSRDAKVFALLTLDGLLVACRQILPKSAKFVPPLKYVCLTNQL